jgi:putative ABC transport system permease protein
MSRRAVRVYRGLLLLYPPAHRRRFGQPMEEVFERSWGAARRGGAGPTVRLLARTTWDLARNVPALWWRALRRPPGRGLEGGRTTMGTRFDDVINDVRHAVRGLRRNPGFAVVALLILGVGIGANAALFSLLHPVLLAPLPFQDAERTVLLLNAPRPGSRFVGISDPFFDAIERGPNPFEALTAFAPTEVNVGGDDHPERVPAMVVSGGFFAVAGVTPLAGRTLLPTDAVVGQDEAAVISEGLWERRFGRDPALVGRTVRIGDRARRVVGVVPHHYRFFADADVWIPLAVDAVVLASPGAAVNNNRAAAALLPEGRTLVEVERGLGPVAARLRERFPDATEPEQGVALMDYREWSVAGVRTGLLTLAAAVGLVLLVACANLANLLLVRNEARRAEFAVREALGAGRGRILRQLLAESLVLGVGGAALGIGIGRLALTLMRPLVPAELGLPERVALDAPVVAFTLGVGLLTGLVFGLAPALARSGRPLRAGLGTRGGGARGGLRRALVIGQVAVTAVLLVGAGLLVRSLDRIGAVDPGFRAQDRWTMEFVAQRSSYPDDASLNAFARTVVEAAAERTGAASAAVGQRLPLRGSSNWGYTVEGQPEAGVRVADYNLVGPGYFETMGIPLLRGREFEWSDARAAAPVIVSESMARQLWPGEDPIGRRINVDIEERTWREVIGVVGDAHTRSLAAEPPDLMYFPPVSLPFASPYHLSVIVTTPERPAPAVALREALASVDGGIPPGDVLPLSGLVAGSEARRRFLMALFSSFSGIALVLAMVGLYGVVAYGVALRSREFGLRMALGAGPERVRAIVLRQGAVMTAIGLAAGLGAAVPLGRFVTSFLYGVEATDPLTYALVGVLLAVVALLAALVPARRATRLDPATTLRSE